jgi:hypothetical protein
MVPGRDFGFDRGAAVAAEIQRWTINLSLKRSGVIEMMAGV